MSFSSLVYDAEYDSYPKYGGGGEIVVVGGNISDSLPTFNDVMSDFLDDDAGSLPLASRTGDAVKKESKAEFFKKKTKKDKTTSLADRVKKKPKSLADSVKRRTDSDSPDEEDEPGLFDLEPLSKRVRDIPPEGSARAQEDEDADEERGEAFGDIGSQADDSAPIADLGMFTSFVQVVE